MMSTANPHDRFLFIQESKESIDYVSIGINDMRIEVPRVHLHSIAYALNQWYEENQNDLGAAQILSRNLKSNLALSFTIT